MTLEAVRKNLMKKRKKLCQRNSISKNKFGSSTIQIMEISKAFLVNFYNSQNLLRVIPLARAYLCLVLLEAREMAVKIALSLSKVNLAKIGSDSPQKSLGSAMEFSYSKVRHKTIKKAKM